jgi:PAS domain S-box-containing protein
MNDYSLQFSLVSGILDSLSIGVICLSADRRIRFANRSAETLTGRLITEIIGKDCKNVFLQNLCGGECLFHNVLLSKESPLVTDVEITDPSSESHYITKIVSPLYDKGHIAGCMVIFQDRSAIKDLLERIRYEERRLKAILDNIDIGIFTVDKGGHVTFFNTQAEHITGYLRQDILGRECSVFFGNKSQDMRHFNDTVKNGVPRTEKEVRLITQNGQAVPIRANYMALKNDEGRIVGGLATISDLSLAYHFDSAIKERYTFYDMVGKDPAIQKIFDMVPVVSASDATVLIEGATGTGKDVLAKLIHTAGKRAHKPMVKVNCAALPDNLLESEMFGYVKGAFTGADRDKPGRFQDADGGTLFLDEIGDLPFSLQAKLLRVLEDKEFYPLGSRRTTRVDVRIISATNQGLEKLVREKKFREDLFYRLNVIRFELPPIKKRKSDLPLLISHILKRQSLTRRTQISKISEEAMEILLNHDYPGNVRELENILEHALIICQGKTIEKRHLPPSLATHTECSVSPSVGSSEKPSSKDEMSLLVEVLQKNDWNRQAAAAELKIDRTTLWRKMKKYNLLAFQNGNNTHQ